MDTFNALEPAPPRKKMPAEVFVKIWTGEIEVAGTEWENHIKFTALLDKSFTKFSNIEVEWLPVSITSNEKLLPNLNLSNCWLIGLYLINAKIDVITALPGSIIDLIHIENSSLTQLSILNARIGDIEIREKSEVNSIRISRVSETGNLLILNSISGDLMVDKSQVGDFKIVNSKSGDFRINDSTNGSLVLDNSQANNFIIENSKIEDIKIKLSKTENIRITKNSILKNIEVVENSVIGRLSLKEESSSGSFIGENSKISALYLEKSNLAKIRIWHSEVGRIQIKLRSFVSLFQCQFNLHIPVHVILENSDFGNLNFDNSVSPEFTTYNISDCKVNHLTMNNFCNYGTIFFSNLGSLKEWTDFKRDGNDNPIINDNTYAFENISSNPTLRFTDSDLGKIQFINCDLREFKRFEFSNTKMLDAFVAGSQMPDDESFVLPGESNEFKILNCFQHLGQRLKTWFKYLKYMVNPPSQDEIEKNQKHKEKNLKMAEQKRLAYGQFKKIFEVRGDVAGSLPHLASEMEAYRQQLQMDGLWKNKGELAMLWANKLSTNYGVSWQRGFIILIVFWSLSYWLFCYLVRFPYENNSPDDWPRFWKVVSYAPYYLNPLRDKDSVFVIDDDGFTSCGRIWDFVSRIVITFFAYQTIQAFRKLGKSSG